MENLKENNLKVQNFFQKISLTDEEIGKLGDSIKWNKFNNKGNEIIYPVDNIEKLEFFIKGYRYLFSLINSIKYPEKEEFKGIIEKIISYLNEIKILYEEGCIISIKYNNSLNFNKHRKKTRINEFVNENKEIIDTLLDLVYPLGRVIKQFNPDESMAYY